MLPLGRSNDRWNTVTVSGFGRGRRPVDGYNRNRRLIKRYPESHQNRTKIGIDMADIRLALYEPDIPQNTGAILRLGACLGVAVDIIEPCGFVLDDRKLRRAGMDYLERADMSRHVSWQAFLDAHAGRLVLLTTRGGDRLAEFRFRSGDTIVLGRESAGVPDAVHAAADARLAIPMMDGARSLNVALAAALALGEALRQTGQFPSQAVPEAASP